MEKPAARLVCWGRRVWGGLGRKTRKSSQAAAAGIAQRCCQRGAWRGGGGKTAETRIRLLGINVRGLEGFTKGCSPEGGDRVVASRKDDGLIAVGKWTFGNG